MMKKQLNYVIFFSAIFFVHFFTMILWFFNFLHWRFVLFELRSKWCISCIDITLILVCSQHRMSHRFFRSRLKIKCLLSRWYSSLIHTGILRRSWKRIIHIHHWFLTVISLLLSRWSRSTVLRITLPHLSMCLLTVVV